MTQRHLAIGLGLLLATFASASEAQLASANCKSVTGSVGAVKVKPGLYVGTFYGDLSGAVSLVTLKESIDPDGTRHSVIDFTFVTKDGRSAFDAMLTATDEPLKGGYARTAWGSITGGKGDFEKLTGKINMTGEIDDVNGTFKADMRALLCGA